jgi:hypothetical protein
MRQQADPTVESMRRYPLCGCIGEEVSRPRPRLPWQLRRRRLIAGLIVTTLAIAALAGHFYLAAVVWGWIGLAHIAAALTGYPGCPEIGLIVNAVRRQDAYVHGVWCRSDRRFYTDQAA